MQEHFVQVYLWTIFSFLLVRYLEVKLLGYRGGKSISQESVREAKTLRVMYNKWFPTGFNSTVLWKLAEHFLGCYCLCFWFWALKQGRKLGRKDKWEIGTGKDQKQESASINENSWGWTRVQTSNFIWYEWPTRELTILLQKAKHTLGQEPAKDDIDCTRWAGGITWLVVSSNHQTELEGKWQHVWAALTPGI